MRALINAEADVTRSGDYGYLVGRLVLLLLCLSLSTSPLRAGVIERPYWGHVETSRSSYGSSYVSDSQEGTDVVLRCGNAWVPYNAITVEPGDSFSTSGAEAVPRTGVIRFTTEALNYSVPLPGNYTAALGGGTIYLCSFWTVESTNPTLEPGHPVSLAVDYAIQGSLEFCTDIPEPSGLSAGYHLEFRLGKADNAYWLDGTPWYGDWFETNPFPNELLLLKHTGGFASGPSDVSVDVTGAYDAMAAVGDVVVLETRVKFAASANARPGLTWASAFFSDTLVTGIRSTTPDTQLVAYVPEPPTWILSLAGIAGAALIVRRRWRRIGSIVLVGEKRESGEKSRRTGTGLT